MNCIYLGDTLECLDKITSGVGYSFVLDPPPYEKTNHRLQAYCVLYGTKDWIWEMS